MQLTQLTNTIVMSPPTYFGFNDETAQTNKFQNDLTVMGLSAKEVQENAIAQFRSMAELLTLHGITVLELPNRKDVKTPDAVFPNNWFSHNNNGQLIIYPMLTKNRREEKQKDSLVTLLVKNDISVTNLVDLSKLENENLFLEGTGSLVLDRVNNIAFAMESSRTSKEAVEVWQEYTDYQVMFLHSYDNHQFPIYHTNVVMNIGEGFTICCTDAIISFQEKEQLGKLLKQCDSELITISMEQLYAFCGNIIHLKNSKGKKKIILSQTAYDNFTLKQRKRLERYGELIPVAISTIESVGGGSARCMIAEVFKN